jgi:hypothetical protein
LTGGRGHRCNAIFGLLLTQRRSVGRLFFTLY